MDCVSCILGGCHPIQRRCRCHAELLKASAPSARPAGGLLPQATSGRGEVPYAPGEGLGYWRAAALHLGRHQREHAALHMSMHPSWYTHIDRSRTRSTPVPPPWPPETFEGTHGRPSALLVAEKALINRHAAEILSSSSIARNFPQLEGNARLETERCRRISSQRTVTSLSPSGEPLLQHWDRELGLLDVIALDFAPSYNFNVDSFAFDHELRAIQRAVRFTPSLHQVTDP